MNSQKLETSSDCSGNLCFEDARLEYMFRDHRLHIWYEGLISTTNRAPSKRKHAPCSSRLTAASIAWCNKGRILLPSMQDLRESASPPKDVLFHVFRAAFQEFVAHLGPRILSNLGASVEHHIRQGRSCGTPGEVLWTISCRARATTTLESSELG